MMNLLILLLFLISGSACGLILFDVLPEEVLNSILFERTPIDQVSNLKDLRLLLASLGAFLGLITGFLIQKIGERLIKKVRTMPTDLLISRSLGLILGLLIANLLLAPILILPLPKSAVLVKPITAAIINIFLGLVGYSLGEVHGRTLLRLFNPNSAEALLIAEGILTPASPKILDTSIIIDGRINELLSCGLIEGQVIVSQSVIDELQQLADSSNNEKRAKGRRGLKLLNKLKDSYEKKIVLNNTKYEGKGTDNKLLQLTEDTSGILITSDYNLSQVAQVKNLKVLNLSELIIALQPDVQPGAKLNIKIVREGKENDQGVGYLEDGTMVVIEQAKEFLGSRLEIVVTGALQTPTGRMIFGRQEKDQTVHKSDKTKAN